MYKFKPPKDSKLAIILTRVLYPLAMKLRKQRISLKIVGDGLKRYRALKGKRVIVCPNHSAQDDADVLLGLACLVGEDFNVMVANELFERHHGYDGIWLQWIGCYSVLRGGHDVESVTMSKNLLLKGQKKLVIFPEGEISYQNDRLISLEPGAAKIGLWSLEELRQKGKKDSVYILPVAVKYTHLQDLSTNLMKCLEKLESELEISIGLRSSPEQRLMMVFQTVLSTWEAEQEVSSPPSQSLGDRIGILQEAMLKNVAESMQIDLPEDASIIHRCHVLQNEIVERKKQIKRAKLSDKSRQDRKEILKGYAKDTRRVISLSAMSGICVSDHRGQEHLVEAINLLEEEIFGKVSKKGPELVLIDVGVPIDLDMYYEKYKTDKKAQIGEVTLELTRRLQEMLVGDYAPEASRPFGMRY
jgi:glycosyltransferase involved in cell wall biosynthesis